MADARDGKSSGSTSATTVGSTWVSRLSVALAPAAIALALAVAGGLRLAPSAEATSITPAGSVQTVADATSSAGGTFSAAQKTELEKIIRGYLLANPEVLFEAKEAFDRKQEEQQLATMKKSIGENKVALFQNVKEPAVNAAGADVTVVEFFDYNCHFCQVALEQVASLADKDKKVRIVFKEFPIFGEDSESAARFALAANKQGKYWEMHRALYERKGQGKANGALALEIAPSLGLDVAKLQADAESSDVKAEIAATRALAEKMGIQGTPHFIIGDNIIPGAPRNLLEVMNGHIASIRKNGCSVC
jgi:protein-disulfide isomerase